MCRHNRPTTFGSAYLYIRIGKVDLLEVAEVFQREVLLYHPRDLKPAGYYAAATLIDFYPDPDDARFCYLVVTNIQPFKHAVTPSDYAEHIGADPSNWSYRHFAPDFDAFHFSSSQA